MAASATSLQLLPIRSLAQLTAPRLAQGADAGFAAFAPDPVFRWLRPHPTPDYDERLRLYFEDRLRNVVIRRGKDRLVLALRSDGAQRTETVLGWAIWERRIPQGSEQLGDEDYDWGSSPAQSTNHAEVEAQIIKRDPDRAEDEARLTAFNEAWNQAEMDIPKILESHGPQKVSDAGANHAPNGDSSIEPPHMKLTFIAVHPDYQRQGVGKVLVEWGCRKADRDGVPIVLGASPVGEGLYRKCGFENLGVQLWVASEQDEAEYGRLNDNILVRWPQ